MVKSLLICPIELLIMLKTSNGLFSSSKSRPTTGGVSKLPVKKKRQQILDMELNHKIYMHKKKIKKYVYLSTIRE